MKIINTVLLHTQCPDCGQNLIAVKEHWTDDGTRLTAVTDTAWDEVRFSAAGQSGTLHSCCIPAEVAAMFGPQA